MPPPALMALRNWKALGKGAPWMVCSQAVRLVPPGSRLSSLKLAAVTSRQRRGAQGFREPQDEALATGRCSLLSCLLERTLRVVKATDTSVKTASVSNRGMAAAMASAFGEIDQTALCVSGLAGGAL